jgi:mycothiol synthase
MRAVDLPADSAALLRLIADVERYDLHPALGERKYFPLVDPLEVASSEAPGLIVEEESRLLAYVALMEEGQGLWTVETVVHPKHREESFVDNLVGMVCQHVQARGGSGLRLWAYIPEVKGAAERAGFKLERALYHMRVALPLDEMPNFADNIVVRRFREGVDEDAWLNGNNQVFSGHPENGNWGMADLDRRRRRSWFSSVGMRMAWDGEVLAGFCWTKVPSTRAGEIYVIGVLPGYQGRGLGKALLLEGIRHMHTHDGARACVLYVDSGNVPAVNMYRSMGFSHHHTDHSYLLPLDGEHGPSGAGTLPVELRREF